MIYALQKICKDKNNIQDVIANWKFNVQISEQSTLLSLSVYIVKGI